MAEPARHAPPTNDPEVERAWREAPENFVAEILDGELSLQPRPARLHTKVASDLGIEIGPPFARGRGGPGGWIILDEPELWFGPRPDKVVPDLAGWRRERMPDALGDDTSPPYYEIAPDWVCEILSPGTERRDRGKKMRIYRRESVAFVWLVNPGQQTLEVYRLQDGNWTLVDTHDGSDKVRAMPFDAIELDLGLLWGK
jgi:Uma2 family endonuclease